MQTFFTLLLDGSVKEGLYWADVTVNVIAGAITAIITAAITSWMLDKAFRKSKYLGDSISKAGIEKIDYTSGRMTQKDRNILFGLKGNQMPNELKLCFITGDNFFKDNFDNLVNLVKNGRIIKVLIGNPNLCKHAENYFKEFSSDHSLDELHCSDDDKEKLANIYLELNELHGDDLRKLSYLERTYLMVSKDIIDRKVKEKYVNLKYSELSNDKKKEIWIDRISSTGDHVMQAVLVTRMIEKINKESVNGGKIELRYYHDEYRIPITLAEYYADGAHKEGKMMLWTNMNAPVRETTKSVNVFGIDNFEEDATYVNDVKCTFDYLFEKYSESDNRPDVKFQG